MRVGEIHRKTKETDIRVSVHLDQADVGKVDTGIPFFDHMLAQFSRHGQMGLAVQATGDLEIDGHHLTEDTGYAIGSAIRGALGDRSDIQRFGYAYAPLDCSLSRAVLDLSGRAYLVLDVDFGVELFGSWQAELVREWFQAMASSMGANIHLMNLYGINSHHKVESLFKAFALAFRQAVTVQSGGVASTKGVLRVGD